ncbi:MAG: hypothetical protein EOS12_16050 [Mesorhizobium sp.]|nr:MAG: hypothetical protein EOS12_16050 [Mesorhizobium sp.]
MAEFLISNLAVQGCASKRAEKSLKRAKEETDRKNGVVNIALCCRIRAAQQRVRGPGSARPISIRGRPPNHPEWT